jgi:pimeloyl-ACP methyl ester carboxylesterase
MDLYYEECGGGDVIIFLHGNGETHNIFAKSIEHFRKKYKVYAIDSRGHGQSGYAPMSIPLMALDVIEFIEKKGLSNITLIGFSDGGNIALEVASVLSANISNLVVVGANLYPSGMKLNVRFEVYIVMLLCGLFCFIPSLRKKRLYYKIMAFQPRISEYTLHRIQAKTLVVAGAKDMIKHSHTLEIHKHIYGSEVAIIDGGDHFLFANKNEEINELIASFID